MPRNIDHRVEVLFPIEHPQLIRHLCDDVLEVYLSDNVEARRLLPDGTYELIKPRPDEPALNSQTWLLTHRPKLTKVEEI